MCNDLLHFVLQPALRARVSGGAIFLSPRSRHRQRIVMLADGVITVRIRPSFLPFQKGLLPDKLTLGPAAG